MKKNEILSMFKCCHFVEKHVFGIKYLHANVQCLFIVYTKYQSVLEIIMGGVEFLMQALSKQYIELQRKITLKVLNPSPYQYKRSCKI